MMKRTAKRSALGSLAAALLLVACEQEPSQESPSPDAAAAADTIGAGDEGKDVLLARVGEARITLHDFTVFYAKMPDYLQSGRVGAHLVHDHLQTLIDMELLQFESVAQGVDQTPAFLSKAKRQRMDRLIGLYLVDKIKIRLPFSEVRQYWEDEGLARTVRFSQIVVSSLDSAQGALRDIASGASFAEAARMWSTHAESAQQGGDTGRYVNRLDLPPRLGDRLFALSEGEVSEPIDLNGAYGIFTLLTQFDAELTEDRFRTLFQQLFMQRSVAERRALVDSLEQELKFVLDESALDDLVAIAHRGAWQDPALGDLAIYSYREGQITGRDVIESVDPLDLGSLRQMPASSMLERLRRTLVPDAILMTAAVRDGYAEREDIATWLQQRYQEELIIQLRVKILQERIEITEAEIRQEYEDKPDRYSRPELITLEEVLVETEAEAQKVRERIEAGASIAELARQMSLRSLEHRDENGKISLTLADGRYLGRLAASAYRTQPGELVGPLHVNEGYSVYRLLDRKKVPATYAESRRRAKATVNWIKKQLVFDAFLQDLRVEYADRVELFEDGIRQAVAD